MKRESNIFTRKIRNFIAMYSAIVSIFTMNMSSMNTNYNSTMSSRVSTSNIRVLSDSRMQYYVPELPEVKCGEDVEVIEVVEVEDSSEDYVLCDEELYDEITEADYTYEYEDDTVAVCSEVVDGPTDEYIDYYDSTVDELYYTDDEVYLMAKVCLAEAEGETELGKRLVVSTILNRIDSGYYSDNVYDVVYQPYQFEVTMNGRIDRVTVTDDVIQLVREEIENRTNYDVIYFRTDHYSEYGTPLFQEDSHYFSAF